MAHVHSHGEDRSTYFLDQLFMIAICGALAGVTLSLYFSGRLVRMLNASFHIYVLLGGLGLLALVVARAVAVWRAVDQMALPDAPPDEPGHGHSHGHSHSHGNGNGHDHGWSPWRYVVLLLPVALYFLVLTNPTFDTGQVYNATGALDKIQNFIIIFRSILWEALPFIVLGAVMAGLLEELVPQGAITKILPRNRWLAIGLGGLLGLIFPMCECGIVPVMRRLLRKGLPLSCCVSYLLAGPIVNVIVLISTYVAFSGMENVYEGGKPSYQMSALWMTGFRAGLGYLIAVTTACLVEWLHRKHGDAALLTPLARPGNLPLVEEEAAGKGSLWDRINRVTETALHDFVDITVFLILGALVAASTRMVLSPEAIADYSRQHAVLAIVLMMGLAIVMCLCSEADAFVAASFVTLRPSAKLAFLVLGPMLDFKLYFMYTRVFRPRLIWSIYLSLIVQVFVFSYAVHLFWEKYGPQLVTPKPLAPSEHVINDAFAGARTFGLLAGPTESGPWLALGAAGAVAATEEAKEMNPLQLQMASFDRTQRNYYEGKRIRIVGEYRPINAREFTLVRYRRQCCDADAVPMPMIMQLPKDSKELLPDAQLNRKWVVVTGTIHFLQRPGTDSYVTTLQIHPSTDKPLYDLVVPVPAPMNPYIE
jgi:uncharacterized membrane protein YraQ (UPF0718 family)